MVSRLSSAATTIIVALVAITIAACEVESPDRIFRAPIIKAFSPQSAQLEAFVGDAVRFSLRAVDPADEAVSYFFTLDDEVAADGPTWTYTVDDTGLVEVCGHATNGEKDSVVRWTLTRLKAINLPPVVVDAQPSEPHPMVIVGNKISFSMTAQDPEGKPLSYVFTVDDSLVSGSNRYTYPAPEIGDFVVNCIAWDGEENGFASHAWNLSVLAEPDSIPPAPVVIQSLVTGPETGELVVRWTAVGNDGMEGLPSTYIVRTLSIPIDNETQWGRAADRPGEPAPATPGELQEMVITNLKPADDVFVAVRAADDFGNLSPLANTLNARVKGNDVWITVRDAITGDPVPDIRVTYASTRDTTDADGTVYYGTLPTGATRISLWDEDDPTAIGGYYDVLTSPIPVVDEAHLDLWVIPDAPLQSPVYTSFLAFVRWMTDVGGTFTHLARTWQAPVDVYVEPFVNNGLDYEAVVKSALDQWELLVGIDLFKLVDAVPSYGFYVTYDSDRSRDVYELVETAGQQKLPIVGRITHRTHFAPENADFFFQIASHEIGHALCLQHSEDPMHLMIGGRSPVAPYASPDEVALIRVLYHLPPLQPMDWFLFD